MTVEELIKELQTKDPKAEIKVMCCQDEKPYNIKEIINSLYYDCLYLNHE